MSERSEAVQQHAVRDVVPAYRAKPVDAVPDDVPPGYKRTEVGVIPEKWQVSRIGLLSWTSSGTTPARSLYERYYKNGSIAWLKTMDLNNSTVFDSSEHVTEAALNETSLHIYPAGTVLIAMYGGFQQIGRTGLLRLAATVNQAITAIQVDTKQLIPEYLLATLNYRVSFWKTIASSSRKDPNITGEDVRAFPCAVPSLDEQRAIATALSDADALIQSLDRLIAKKRAVKQAAMQQLLTGQTRLPGFSGEWETRRLKDVGVFYKGQGIRREDVTDEGMLCIRYGEIYTRYDDCVLEPESRIPIDVANSAFPLNTGDILFAGSGETAGEIGMCVAYLGEQPAFAGGDIVILRPAQGVSAYLGRLLNHPSIAQQKARLGQGDAIVHISARNLAQIEVQLPSEDEQTAIATVLSDMDAEIEALERRRDKTQHVKQGMMQQLLTGRVRLVQPELAA